MTWRAAALSCCIATGGAAQTAGDVAQAVEGWLTDQNARGVVAIQPPDTDLTVIDLGLPADAPVELASLSKAITATCMAQLVDGTTVSRGDPVSRHVPGFDSITLADLITHQSGITQDATQIYMSAWLDEPTHRAAEIVDKMRDRGAPTGQPGQYAYSNDNYALVARVIEAVSDAPYEQTCRRLVLDPAGVTATPSPVSGAFLSWGGWSMTVADYLTFHAHWFDTQTDTLTGPAGPFGGGAYYGLGMLARPMQGGINHWHFGALCFPKHLNVGSYAVAFFNDWRVVVAYDACVEWPAMAALDNAIATAIFSR
ncbi:beta-lactamase family protein [Marivita sp. S6314]|uniref:serine hydrolase domain-containing protein n=1 Tax=Marivita sp. S6314 TaxID=2926406 RepID=UPI001FF3B045|nr:serine hydrolase domain-containing protein [Marivita sp. S6314]MCK0148969.1 beta-lactamase family protein [Marivita sp. S6314]